MRAANFLGFLMLGVGLIVILPAITTGQPGGFGGKKNNGGGGFPGGGGGFPGGGMGGMQQDPNAMFEYLAKGRQFFLISETRTLNGPLTQFAQEKGISNGQITRQAYLQFSEWRQKQAAAGGGGFNPGGGGFGTPKGGGPGGFGKKSFEMPGGATAAPSPDQISAAAELEFKNYDRNQDGKLVREEVSQRLRGSFEKYDKNGDGTIDLEEYKEYYAMRFQGGGDDTGGRGGAVTNVIQDQDLDAKPVVYRAGGKMPSGLPKWFMDLDTDADGQVALYEWRRGQKSFDDFITWDINSDGFITPDEALKQQAALVKNGKGSAGSMGFDEGDGEGKRSKKFDFGAKFGEGGSSDGKKKGFPWGSTGTPGEQPAFGRPPGSNPFAPRSTDGGSTDGGSKKKSKKGGN